MKGWQSVSRAYNATRAVALSRDYARPCGAHKTYRAASNDARKFATMAFNLRRGYQLIETWERSHRFKYDIIIRVRPDLVFLGPFPDVWALAGFRVDRYARIYASRRVEGRPA